MLPTMIAFIPSTDARKLISFYELNETLPTRFNDPQNPLYRCNCFHSIHTSSIERIIRNLHKAIVLLTGATLLFV